MQSNKDGEYVLNLVVIQINALQSHYAINTVLRPPATRCSGGKIAQGEKIDFILKHLCTIHIARTLVFFW